jgi:hypothetical protein
MELCLDEILKLKGIVKAVIAIILRAEGVA